MQGRAHRVGRRIGRSTDSSIGLASGYAEGREIEGSAGKILRFFERGAAGAAAVKQNLRVGSESRTRYGIEDLDGIELRAQAVSRSANNGGSAKQRRLGNNFRYGARGRRYDAVVLALCQHNSLRIGARPALESLEQLHEATLPQPARGAECAGFNLVDGGRCAFSAATWPESSKIHASVFRVRWSAQMGILEVFKGSGLRAPSRVRHNGKRVSEILEAHERFVRGDDTGTRADFSGAELSHVDFRRANLAYADFRGANLDAANLREARLSSADLGNAHMRKADLRKADLTEANLSGADLTDALVGGAELFRADLRSTILRGADLGAANLRDAQVSGADFRGAVLQTTILRETKLDGADLSGVDLSTTLLPRDYKPSFPKKSE
jgi:uncharacterized protein YjbI with pentapeptide repeats